MCIRDRALLRLQKIGHILRITVIHSANLPPGEVGMRDPNANPMPQAAEVLTRQARMLVSVQH